MKIIILFLILLFALKVSAQRCFDIVGNDSIKIFLDSKGAIVNNQIAEMYRVFKANSEFFPFNGTVKDYYINDTLAFNGNLKNGYLDGDFSYFDKKGKLILKGYFKNGERDSIWEYYFPDGKLNKRICYKDKFPKIMEQNKKNGKPLITNGNGKYQGTIKTGYNKTENVEVNGNVVNGLPDGKWHIQYFFGKATEIFDNGKFITGINYDGKKYDQPCISFIDYLYVENVNAYRFNCFLDKSTTANASKVEHPILIQTQMNALNNFGSTDISLPAYKGRYDFSLFQNDIIANLNKESSLSFWAFVEFTIGIDGNLIDIKSYSPIDSAEKIIIKALNQIDRFVPANKSETNKKYPSYIFLPIIKQSNNNVMIPKFDNGIMGLNIGQ